MNPQMIMEMLFGKEQTIQILNRWQSMSSEQKQQELQKVQGIPKEKLKQYLSNLGIDTNFLENLNINNSQNIMQNSDRKFNY